MNFLTPAAFFLSLLLPLIVLMYLLKLRRQEQQISSTFLWQRMVRDVEANAPWQRLKRNLLMILQLLFLIALIIAVAQPYFWTQGVSGNSVIIIIDTSASMGSQDIPPSRLEAAKDQALRMVEEFGEDTRVTVITAGYQTEVLVSSSQDRHLVQQAINRVSLSMGESDLTTALQLSSAIASRQPDTEIILLSDGQITLPEHIALNGNLHYYPLGINDNNQAISILNYTVNPSGENNNVFAQVINYAAEPVTRRLEIYTDGNLFDAVELSLAPGAKENYLGDSYPQETEIIEARLAGEDSFAYDDQAWALGNQATGSSITLVTEGNRFLETALRLLPGVSTETITPVGFEQAENLATDIIIFDGYIPSGNLPAIPSLFIGPPSSTEIFSVVGQINQPTPRSSLSDDPLLENVSLAELHILQATQISLPDWAHASVSGETEDISAPLIFYGSPLGEKVAVISFRLQNSDLPLQVAFPLLISNLINWLAPQGISGPSTQSGFATLEISLPLGAQNVDITQPDGSKLTNLQPDQGKIILEAALPGIYTVNWGEDEPQLAVVNFISSQESQISPLDNLPLLAQSDSVSELQDVDARKFIWRPFAIGALILLMIEWFVYHRGTLSRLWQAARNPQGDTQ